MATAEPARIPAETRSAFERFVRWARPGARILGVASRYTPSVQKRLWHRWYNLCNKKSPSNTHFTNYGFAYLDSPGPDVEPWAGEEGDRYPLQLYHRVAGAVDLGSKDVLEIGCGRGGGTAFLKRCFGPRSVTGVDFSEEAVAFCSGHYRIEGLTFIRGDAEDLPLPADSFDAVINVESSHCYPSMTRFLWEVRRVLRDGGWFLFADLWGRGQVETLREQITCSGLTVVEEELITPNVLRALELDSDRKLSEIHRQVPWLFRPFVQNFTGVKGSPIYEAFRTSQLEYVRFVAIKPATLVGAVQ